MAAKSTQIMESKNAQRRQLRYHLLWSLTEVKRQSEKPLLEAQELVMSLLGEQYDNGVFDDNVRQAYAAVADYQMYTQRFGLNGDTAIAQQYQEINKCLEQWLSTYDSKQASFKQLAEQDWPRKYLVEALLLRPADKGQSFKALFEREATSPPVFDDLWSSIPLIDQHWGLGQRNDFPSPEALLEAISSRRPENPLLPPKRLLQSEEQHRREVRLLEEKYLQDRRQYEADLGFVAPLNKPMLEKHMKWLAQRLACNLSLRDIARKSEGSEDFTTVKSALDKLAPLVGVGLP